MSKPNVITASNGNPAFELDGELVTVLDLECLTCGEWPDYAVLSQPEDLQPFNGATFYCSDHV